MVARWGRTPRRAALYVVAAEDRDGARAEMRGVLAGLLGGLRA